MKKNKNYVGKLFYWFTVVLCIFRVAGSILLITYILTKEDIKNNNKNLKFLLIDIFYIP